MEEIRRIVWVCGLHDPPMRPCRNCWTPTQNRVTVCEGRIGRYGTPEGIVLYPSEGLIVRVWGDSLYREVFKMKWFASVMLSVLLASGAAPALGGTLCGDADGDLEDDCEDNCSDSVNPNQDDTDGDGCGNVCDADCDQNGIVNFADFTCFAGAFLTGNPNQKLTEPVTGQVNFADFAVFAGGFLLPPGPSGTTSGQTACP